MQGIYYLDFFFQKKVQPWNKHGILSKLSICVFREFWILGKKKQKFTVAVKEEIKNIQIYKVSC